MKLADLTSDEVTNLNQYLKITDLENMFNVYQDKNGFYFFNLNDTLYINTDVSAVEYKTLDHPMHWPTISYVIYGTTRLAWLLLKVNDIGADEVFKRREAGEKIKFVKKNLVQSIVANLNNFND